jgi:hypothetical protein
MHARTLTGSTRYIGTIKVRIRAQGSDANVLATVGSIFKNVRPTVDYLFVEWSKALYLKDTAVSCDIRP